MQVLVFVTEAEDGTATGPTLFLKDDPSAVLPAHPRSLVWKYFATVEDRDQMVPMRWRPSSSRAGTSPIA